MPHVSCFQCNMTPCVQRQSFAVREQKTTSTVPTSLFVQEAKVSDKVSVGSYICGTSPVLSMPKTPNDTSIVYQECRHAPKTIAKTAQHRQGM